MPHTEPWLLPRTPTAIGSKGQGRLWAQTTQPRSLDHQIQEPGRGNPGAWIRGLRMPEPPNPRTPNMKSFDVDCWSIRLGRQPGRCTGTLFSLNGRLVRWHLGPVRPPLPGVASLFGRGMPSLLLTQLSLSCLLCSSSSPLEQCFCFALPP